MKGKSTTKTKKVVKKKPSVKKWVIKSAKAKKEATIGTVTHFFRKIKVAVVKFKKPVSAGTKVRFRGATTNFVQKIGSMQYDHKPLDRAPKGKQVGMKVEKRVRGGDEVYLEK